MATSISLFKGALTLGGARPHLFKVDLSFPTSNPVAVAESQFLIKATELPGAEVEEFSVMYQGRAVKFAGERRFDNWSITVINNTTFALRNAFEEWIELINGSQNNLGTFAYQQYQRDLKVTQLFGEGVSIKEYKFVNAFPTIISPISLSYDNGAQIEEFNVTFAYDYWLSNTTN